MRDFLLDPAFPDDALPPSTPEAERMDRGPLEAGVAAIEARQIPIHGWLVVRHGRRVLEQHGADEGRPLTPDDLRHLHSTTKTFTSMLVGLALAEGRVPSVEARAAGYFGAAELPGLSAAARRIRLEHLLTMRSGLDYEEGNPREYETYTTARTSAAVFLSRRVVAEPGTRWNYSTGDSQILAEVLQRTAGRSLLAQAQASLFAPLGIGRARWETDGGDTQQGGRALWLRPRDLARFGWMLLCKGRWMGEQVVPAAWIEAATRRHVVADSGWMPGEGYGYHCWVPGLGGFATRGYMGQVMYVLPALALVVVFTAGLVPPEKGDALLDDLMRRYVLPAVG